MEIALLSGQRQSGETDKAVIACNDYLRLGIGRSFSILLEKYAKLHKDTPPTASMDTLKVWSSKFEWVNRAIDYDATWEQRKTLERQAVMDYGLALDYERVNKLKSLADFLEAQLYEQGETGIYHNLWMPDVKQIGNGDNAIRVDIERFNGALVQQYREVLDDLAQEVGGRKKLVDVTSEGKAIKGYAIVSPDDWDKAE